MESNRRPLATRSNKIVQKIAQWLARRSFPTPNQISMLSIAFSFLGAIALASTITGQGIVWELLICAACIQMRLLCNLFDGMVAVEGGKASPLGGLYNEVPDRIADTLFFLALGYALSYIGLGLVISLLAIATAYVRTLGGSLGLVQSFRGPMAKQHRMALLTLACLLGALEWYLVQSNYVLWLAAILLFIGTALTTMLRLRDMAKILNQSAGR